jgi:hypothetical protein
MKIKTLIIVLTLFNLTLKAQKKQTDFGIKAGTTIVLSNASYHKPGVNIEAYLAWASKKSEKNKWLLSGGYYNIVPKGIPVYQRNFADARLGYRFFADTKASIYLQPSAGVAFTLDSFAPIFAVGFEAGYLKQAGRGKVNLFTRYNHIGKTNNGLGFISAGVGYQF